MQPDWERDWSYHGFLKATLGARPAARVFAYEDYVRDRVREIFDLVENQTAACSGRAFEIALPWYGDHLNVIFTRKTVTKTTSTGYTFTFDEYDVLVFDHGGMILEAENVHPVTLRCAVESVVLQEAKPTRKRRRF